jgi:GT2 family glycosyltransferase
MNPGPPLVSVCIANYNGMTVIDDCLQSVLRQEGGITVEIIVHDDASIDGSAAFIRDQYPDVRLMESSENVGFCVANNRMAAQARGNHILLLNNDAALYPDALRTLLSEAARLDRPAILGLPQYDAGSDELVDIGSLLDPFLNPVPNRNSQRNDVGMIIGACLWLPKSLWIELGGFPEWFGSIAEDMYLCCRARLAGYPVRALSTSGYRHWQGMSFGGNRLANHRLDTTFRRRRLSERNKSFVMLMTYPAPLLQIILPMHIALMLVEGFALALVKLDRRILLDIYLATLRSMYKERERIRRLRKEIQSARQVTCRTFLAPFVWLPHKLNLLLRHGVPRIS